MKESFLEFWKRFNYSEHEYAMRQQRFIFSIEQIGFVEKFGAESRFFDLLNVVVVDERAQKSIECLFQFNCMFFFSFQKIDESHDERHRPDFHFRAMTEL
jgi:hypothetical protein